MLWSTLSKTELNVCVFFVIKWFVEVSLVQISLFYNILKKEKWSWLLVYKSVTLFLDIESHSLKGLLEILYDYDCISVFSVSTFCHTHIFLDRVSCFWMSKRDSPARLLAKDLIAGCFGGIGIAVAGHPFDTIKVNILFWMDHLIFPLLNTIANSEPWKSYLQGFRWLRQEDHAMGRS